MSEEAPKRGRRRGLRRCMWLAVPFLAIAALPALNLWLACPPGRSWIAEKIHHRTGLETRIGGASVSPWNGIQVQRLEMLQPPPLRAAVKEPFLKVETLKLTPVWRAWLRGRTEIQAMDLVSPHAAIPVELLANLAHTRGTAQSPPVASSPPQPAAAEPAEKTHPPAAAPSIPQTPAPKSAGQIPPTGWLRVKDASIRIVSASNHRDLLSISGISGDVPVSGNGAQSKLRVEELHITGERTLSRLEGTLRWQPPFLTLQPLETTTHEVRLVAAGQAALVRGLPVQVEIQAPSQPLPTIHLPHESHVEAAAFTTSARFRGLLLGPASWQGEWVAQTERIKVGAAGHEENFDRGFMVTTLRDGQLSCSDARLIGDDLSLLGNATLIADGRLAAVLRVVAPPDAAAAIGTRLLPNPQCTPLSTPQRVALDLHATGNLQQIRISQSAAP